MRPYIKQYSQPLSGDELCRPNEKKSIYLVLYVAIIHCVKYAAECHTLEVTQNKIRNLLFHIIHHHLFSQEYCKYYIRLRQH